MTRQTVTAKNGTEAFKMIHDFLGKEISFSNVSEGYNREDIFTFTAGEGIFISATCTPDNSRVECIEIINTNEGGSARHPLTVYINADATVEADANEYAVNPDAQEVTVDAEIELAKKVLKQARHLKSKLDRKAALEKEYAELSAELRKEDIPDVRDTRLRALRRDCQKKLNALDAEIELAADRAVAVAEANLKVADKELHDALEESDRIKIALWRQAEYLQDKISRESKPLDDETLPDCLPVEIDDTDDELIDPPTDKPLVEGRDFTHCRPLENFGALRHVYEIQPENRSFAVGNETIEFFNGKWFLIESPKYGVIMLRGKNVPIVYDIQSGGVSKTNCTKDEFFQIMTEREACSIDNTADIDLAEAERKKLIAELKADGYKFIVTTIKLLIENDSATVLPTKTYVQTYEKALHELNLQAKFYATNPALDGGFELATLDGKILFKGDKVAEYEKVIVDKNQPLVDKKPITKRKNLRLVHANRLKEARL